MSYGDATSSDGEVGFSIIDGDADLSRSDEIILSEGDAIRVVFPSAKVESRGPGEAGFEHIDRVRSLQVADGADRRGRLALRMVLARRSRTISSGNEWPSGRSKT